MAEEFPQPGMIDRLRELCSQDPDLRAAMLYGSFPLGEADEFSDIDCLLYFRETALPAIDRREWISRLAPLLLFYQNEFGNWAAVFENIVRGEFHFYPESKMADLDGFAGSLWFPSAQTAVLVDKNGDLARRLQDLTGPQPTHGDEQDLEYLTNSFCNWMVFGANVYARGEHARALEILHLVQDVLLRLVRMHAGSTRHWITPTRQLENEISALYYREFQSCTAPLEPAALRQAYQHAWRWGRSLLEKLYAHFGIDRPVALIEPIERHVSQRLGFSPEL